MLPLEVLTPYISTGNLSGQLIKMEQKNRVKPVSSSLTQFSNYTEMWAQKHRKSINFLSSFLTP